MDLKENLSQYIAERMMMMPEVGDVVCLNDRFRNYYKAKTKIYGEVVRIDKTTRVAKVDWDIKHVLPDSIPVDHLKVDEDEDDQLELDDEPNDRIQGGV